jgi:hypothetical protein
MGVCEMKERTKIKVEDKHEDKAEERVCHHYWVIEVANGPKSVGKCKNCGEVEEFFNAFPDFNPMRRKGSPLDLPKLPEVEMDKDSES